MTVPMMRMMEMRKLHYHQHFSEIDFVRSRSEKPFSTITGWNDERNRAG
jgi:hypothetical protein